MSMATLLQSHMYDFREVHGFYRRYLVWLDAHRSFRDRLTAEDRAILKALGIQS